MRTPISMYSKRLVLSGFSGAAPVGLIIALALMDVFEFQGV